MFSLYYPRDDELAAFGENWCGPTEYEHGKEHLVAKYPADEGGDGQPVEVYCCAWPARFYIIKAMARPNSVGQPQPAFEVRTGSSASKLAADVASAIADGMLGFYPAQAELPM